MSVAESIRRKLTERLAPVHLKIENESDLHSGPRGRESHFYVVVVSDQFRGLGLAARQRLVFQALEEELKNGLHALAQKTFTPEEWTARGGQEGTGSPPCHGGGH